MKIDLILTTEDGKEMPLGRVEIKMTRSRKLIREDVKHVENRIAGAVVKAVSENYGANMISFMLLRSSNMRIDAVIL